MQITTPQHFSSQSLKNSCISDTSSKIKACPKTKDLCPNSLCQKYIGGIQHILEIHKIKVAHKPSKDSTKCFSKLRAVIETGNKTDVYRASIAMEHTLANPIITSISECQTKNIPLPVTRLSPPPWRRTLA